MQRCSGWPTLTRQKEFPVIRKTLPLALALGALVSLSACSNKASDADAPATDASTAPAAAPGTAPAPAASADTASAAAGSNLTPWTGDLEAAGTPNQMCALDAVNGTKAVGGRFEIPAGQAATFDGWVAGTDMQAPPTLSIVLDGAADFQVTGTTGISRDDVAKAYNAEHLANAGFKLDVASLAIPTGDYKVMIAHLEGGAWVACESNTVLAVK
jgi:hypothetical protein